MSASIHIKMLFKFAEYPKAPAIHPSSPPPPYPAAPGLGLCIKKGKAVCRGFPQLCRAVRCRATSCTADCIKHKLLYLIGLHPALITTNSLSLQTALLPLCRTGRVKVTHPCSCEQKDGGRRGDDADAGSMSIQG